MRVLILRPPPGNAATAAAAQAIGLDPVVVPLFEIVPVAWSPPDPARFDGIVMTSANAARHGGAELARFTNLPLYAVGAATAAAGRAAGFREVVTGDGDSARLSMLIPPDARILHLTGEDSAALPGAAVETVAVYRAKLLPIAGETVDLLASCPIALIHSPRAGLRFAELCPARARVSIVAISPAAAAACGEGWARVVTADRPRDTAILALARRMCEAGDVNEENG